MLTPTAQHKLCLETSFTNLQHQLELRAVQPGGAGGGGGGSKASSIAGSIFGRSQLSSTTTPYDISSVLDDSITTVAMRGKSPCSMLSESTTVILNASANEAAEDAPRLKAVAFDMTLTPPPAQRALPKHAMSSLSPSRSPARGLQPSSLARQHSEKKPRSLPITQALRRASVSGQGVDLLHDDWYGLAPLASPETLSEISSVSSRNSVPISLANSIERYLQHMGVTAAAAAAAGVPKVPLEDIFESQLHTPKVMRRAPKFTENLAGCAEDSRNLDQYKRLGRVFVTFPRIFPGDSSMPGHLGLQHQHQLQHKRSLDSNSSDDSFESAHSLHRLQLPTTVACGASSKSADQLDETRISTPPVKKLTFSDSNILADEHCLRLCPHCPCRRDGRDECCTRSSEHDHQQCQFASLAEQPTTTTAVGSTDTNCSFYSASSSLEQFATPGHRQVQVKLNGGHALDEILIRPGVLESHFPVYGGSNGSGNEPPETPAIVAPASPSPLSNGNGGKRPDVVGGRVRKRLSSEEFVFTRTEDLPMLVQIGDRSGNNSPSGRGKQRRGCCVYPVGNSVRIAGTGVGVDVVPDAAVAAASPTSISKFSRTRVAAAATAKAAAAADAAAAAATAAGINNESNV